MKTKTQITPCRCYIVCRHEGEKFEDDLKKSKTSNAEEKTKSQVHLEDEMSKIAVKAKKS